MNEVEIANAVNISYEQVSNIMHEHFHTKKLSESWMPCLLTIDQKNNFLCHFYQTYQSTLINELKLIQI